MTQENVDEAYIQLAIHDNPDLPESFIRDVVNTRSEPLTEYEFGWIREKFERQSDDSREEN